MLKTTFGLKSQTMTTFYEFQLISVPTFWTHIFFKVLFLNLRETVGRITGEKERKVKGIQESKTEKCRGSEK